MYNGLMYKTKRINRIIKLTCIFYSTMIYIQALNNKLYSNYRNKLIRCILKSTISTNSNINDKEKPYMNVIYTGLFSNKMKWLRRISLGSTILSIAFFVSYHNINIVLYINYLFNICLF